MGGLSAVGSFFLCILHILLRIVGGLMTKLVFGQIKKKSSSQLEAQDKVLLKCLKEEGNIHVKATGVKKKSKNLSVAKADFKQHSFAGREEHVLLTLYPKLMEITCPKDEREKSPTLQQNWELRMAA